MILLIILLFLLFFFSIIYTFNIKLEIKNLQITLPKLQGKITNNDSKVSLKIYILEKIKIVEINLKKIDFKDEKVRRKIQKQLGENNLNLDTIKLLRNINYIVEKLNLNIYFGTEDSAITAISVGILYTIISNFLNGRIKSYKDIKFKVNPIYKDKNIIEIYLDSIISLKVENIINIINFLRKGRGEKDARSSDRKSYAYSNE